MWCNLEGNNIMTNEIIVTNDYDIKAMESALIDGDLSKLNAAQRVIYYRKTCESLGLNYLTKPFAYIKLNGKLTLYALKDCTEQLRKRDGVSIHEMKTNLIDGVLVATAYAKTKDGKEDVSTGAVHIAGLKGENLANAYMKCETKAKRRVTLSICGLGWVDASEIQDIPSAEQVKVDYETGEIENDQSPQFLIEKGVRDALRDKIQYATSLDSLKTAYGEAYVAHNGKLDFMKDLTELKDKVKEALLEENPEPPYREIDEGQEATFADCDVV